MNYMTKRGHDRLPLALSYKWSKARTNAPATRFLGNGNSMLLRAMIASYTHLTAAVRYSFGYPEHIKKNVRV